MGDLKISIVIPTLNQGRFIDETIRSVLTQDYRPIEVLVVDGGSSDETIDVLRSYDAEQELSWISEPDGGVADAVNKGFSLVTGNIVGIQSSDDLYLPGAFVKVAAIFEGDSDLQLVFGEADYIDEDSCVRGKSNIGEYSLLAFLSRRSYILQSSTFFRKGMVDQLGGWKSEVSYVADKDFWLRICMCEKVKSIPDVLSQYRRHSKQRDMQKERIAHEWSKMIRMSPDIRDMSVVTRMAARSGVYVTRAHYTDDSRWIRKSWYTYLALICCPSLFETLDKRDIRIGYRPIRKTLSRLKKLLLRIMYA